MAAVQFLMYVDVLYVAAHPSLFSQKITKANCKSLGVGDYFTKIAEAMDLTRMEVSCVVKQLPRDMRCDRIVACLPGETEAESVQVLRNVRSRRATYCRQRTNVQYPGRSRV
jgi:hypothetical protein